MKESFLEYLMKPEEVENKFMNVKDYIKYKGGGILWIISYWILYIILTEIYILNFNILRTYILSFVIYLILGCLGFLLTLSVIRLINKMKKYDSLQEQWRLELRNDFAYMLMTFNKFDDYVSNHYNKKVCDANISMESSKIQKSILEVKNKYFCEEKV